MPTIIYPELNDLSFESEELETVDILIVDDQLENLISMEAVLSSPNLRLILARSGKEALRAVLDHDFAIILLDVQMPTMDGFETAAIIRQRERSRNTPIIFVTALNKSDKNIFQGYSLGAVDYFFKPYMPDIIKYKVAVFVELYRKTKELKKQKINLEKVNQELEIYSQTIAIDLKFSMQRVLSMADQIREKLLPNTDQKSMEFTSNLLLDSKKIHQLFSSIEDFLKVPNQGIIFKTVQLNELCTEIIKTSLYDAANENIQWEFTDLPEVTADEPMLKLLLTNLISIGIKFSKNILKPQIEIGTYMDEINEMVIYIRDNGIGFEVNDESDFLSSFYHMGVAEDLEGVGISLVVAQRIIRRHGGKMWARSTPGEGTSLFFTLPSPILRKRL